MKLKLLFVCIIVLLPSLGWTACGTACTKSGTTYTCTDISYDCVSAAVSASSVGDTINVASGTATWGTTLTIDKGIYLIGAGSANTIITTTANPGVKYAPEVGAADNPFQLSGFRFNKSTGDNQPILQWGNDENVATAAGNHMLTKGRVDHCIFNATSTVSPLIWMYPGTYGVFDNNTFNAYDYAFRATEGSDWTGAGWTYWGWTPGTSNAVYIETNTFNYVNDTDGDVGTTSQGSHRWVFRYNTFNVKSSSYSFFDAHGNQPSYFGAVQVSNLYGNLFNAGDNDGQMHKIRGGQSFVFCNDWKTTGGAPSITAQEEYADSGGNGPATNAITGQPQHVYNSYFWNNRINTTGNLIDTINDPYGGIPADNVDVWNQTDWNANGSTGVGCGTTKPATCAAGAGFWETTQGNCTDLTGYVGISATKIEGTLYRCSSNDHWDVYYTPYEYPHPLRGETPAATVTTISGCQLTGGMIK